MKRLRKLLMIFTLTALIIPRPSMAWSFSWNSISSAFKDNQTLILGGICALFGLMWAKTAYDKHQLKAAHVKTTKEKSASAEGSKGSSHHDSQQELEKLRKENSAQEEAHRKQLQAEHQAAQLAQEKAKTEQSEKEIAIKSSPTPSFSAREATRNREFEVTSKTLSESNKKILIEQISEIENEFRRYFPNYQANEITLLSKLSLPQLNDILKEVRSNLYFCKLEEETDKKETENNSKSSASSSSVLTHSSPSTSSLSSKPSIASTTTAPVLISTASAHDNNPGLMASLARYGFSWVPWNSYIPLGPLNGLLRDPNDKS